MPICAILLAKPSMQALYERVLRRPYPRGQRHVYIGMSWPFQLIESACLSLPPSLHSSFFRQENRICIHFPEKNSSATFLLLLVYMLKDQGQKSLLMLLFYQNSQLCLVMSYRKHLPTSVLSGTTTFSAFTFFLSFSVQLNNSIFIIIFTSSCSEQLDLEARLTELCEQVKVRVPSLFVFVI